MRGLSLEQIHHSLAQGHGDNKRWGLDLDIGLPGSTTLESSLA